MSVRVRFAPSPTGYLHVGGLRTALYNYLFAKHHGGKCILRIEDTDRTRFVENATENLIESLSWAGVHFDEGPVQGGSYGPYTQSERFALYTKYAAELLERGLAYYAFDSAEQLDEMRKKQMDDGITAKYDRHTMRSQYTLGAEETKRLIDAGEPHVIRMKVPEDEEIVFADVIRGEVRIHSREVDDQVLIKSDGFPTYHLANVVDDHLMGITHVIRGEEWLPSTPKHALLYDAFGWDRPVFAHLPLLLNKDKSKLSKRQGSVAVEDFRAKGYLRDAFVNFVALLGWNPTGDREIYTIDELIEFFNLEKVNKSGAVFDTQKLDWMNFQYIKQTPPKELVPQLARALEAKGMGEFAEDYLEGIIVLFRERIGFIEEIPDYASYMFGDLNEFDKDYYRKHIKPETKAHLKALHDMWDDCEEYTHTALHDVAAKYAEEKGIKMKDFIHTLRLAITGKSVGAGMFETMEQLGKHRSLCRVRRMIDMIANKELEA